MRRDLLRILGLWRRQTVWLAAGTVVSLAALASAVSLMAYGAMALAGIVGVPLVLRILGTGRVVLRYAERMVTHTAMFRALSDVRVWLFRRLAAGSAGGLGFRRAGDLLARLVGDVEALDGLYLRILVPLAGAILLLPVLIWGAGLLVGGLFVLAAFVLPGLAARASRDAGDTLARAAGGLRIAALDALTGLREVRAFAAEGRMLALVQAREAALLAAQRSLASRVALAGAVAFLCGQAALLAALSRGEVVGVFLVVAGFEAIGGLSRAGALLGHAAAAAHRVLEAADAPIPVPDPAIPAPSPEGHRLRFEGVSFRWLPDRPPVFDGLSLDITQGARVALLGPSGIGKSSLAALALKVAAPDAGRVLLGDVDIATLPASEVRARIGWLSQATHLFDDTIRANLLLARPDATDDALWAALDAARIADVVHALPQGLDTWVGEGGRRFSGGQGRRLALARALLSRAPILILDEPCAGLDAETEREFLTALNDTAEGRTVVLITHRLVGVERLDRIFRLSRGKAVAAAG
jgi:ATP-binding cassette subfamily C protein CydC